MSKNVEKVKTILNIEENMIPYMEFCEEAIKNKILDVCNIKTIPERLNTLIQEFLIEQYNLNKEGIGEGKKQISSISDNGQTVSFQTVGGISNVSKSADEFIERNMAQLVAYRKIRW